MSFDKSSLSKILIFGVISLIVICFFITILGPFILAVIAFVKTNTRWQMPEIIALVGSILTVIIVLFAFIFYILMLASSFPQIALTDTGLQYQSFLNHGIIEWNEVSYVTTSKGLFKTKVIVIQRNGAHLLKPKGLFYNFLQGIQFGIYEPVIAIKGKEEGIENKIRENKK